MKTAILILAVVFLLIAIRQIGRFKLKIWFIMATGAIAVMLFGEITPKDALKSINMDVMLFLFGMFVLGRALEQSGLLQHYSYLFFKRASSMDNLVLFILFGAGFLSAFLMNDTIAVIGTPVVLLLANRHNLESKLLLLTLAFAVTIGSVMSPIGNPQNLLIALHAKMSSPFVTFFKYLFLPTIINLFIAYLVLKIFYKDHFNGKGLNHRAEPIKDRQLAFLCKISLAILLLLIAVKIAFVLLASQLEFRLTYIAIASALPILVSKKRFQIIRKIDWSTLLFFASMFILMQAVWDTGFFQGLINGININSIFSILVLSVLFSQVVSNVPFVSLYLPILISAGAGEKELVALAAGSTIAGNLLILGAASNVMIINSAENKKKTLTFWEFAKVGVPLTILNILVYWIFLSLW
ncbi:MAG: SLC13 family permease [Candidatus Woesearchaeota archaeon]